jgi:membrane-bound lytic murein transglycosylase D
MRISKLRWPLLLLIAALVAAFSGLAAAQASPQSASSQGNQPVDAVVDALIARVESEFQKGQTNWNAGHRDAAKENFNRAFDMLLTGPVGVHADERLEREFDKLVESVNAIEMAALQAGEALTEQRSEPAPIDEANDVTFPVDPKIKAVAEAELGKIHSDLPLVMNDQVASFINYFSSRGHHVIENALAHSGRYRAMIERTFKEEGVPQDLIYLAQAESGFHALALSRAGARGMWQFMASRGSGYGLERNFWVDDRQDPEKSTRAAARHLKDLYAQFGDWYLAMAAYNSGPGTVQKAVQRTGYADFWELYRRNVLPGETRNYVPIIVAMTIMAKNPAQYGLENVVPEPPMTFDAVKIDYQVDLRLVAECVETSVTALQELNPAMLRLTTPKDGEFTLRLPVGTRERYEQQIAAIPAEMRVWWHYHKVQDGETLAALAKKYHTTASAIAEANNLDEQAELQNDAKLIIPIRPGTRGDTLTFSKRPTYYKVRKGDTAASVASDYGVPLDRLKKWNHLKTETLTAGSRVVIYRPVAATAEPANPRASASKAGGKKRSSTGTKKSTSGTSTTHAKSSTTGAHTKHKSSSANKLATSTSKKPKPE